MNYELIVPDFGILWPQFVVFVTAVVLSLTDAFLPRERHYTLSDRHLADRLWRLGWCS